MVAVDLWTLDVTGADIAADAAQAAGNADSWFIGGVLLHLSEGIRTSFLWHVSSVYAEVSVGRDRSFEVRRKTRTKES